jgi:Ssp1 endopeptidase immunity protein Rap1a
VRLLLVAALLGFFLVGLPASTSPKSTPEQPERERRPSGDGRSQKEQADISRSGRDFLEVCASVGFEKGAGLEKGAGIEKDSEGNGDGARDFSDAHAWRDATCLGWVAGFTEGFLVHDELLGVPRRDRLACVPNGESTIRIVRVMKKYLADHPEKAHRATRYIASLALAGAFPCRAGK